LRNTEDAQIRLLTAAGEILSALIQGGPAEDIDDYADGADAIECYLTLMRSRAESLHDFLAVAAIRDFVGADERWDVDRPGWNVSRLEAFHAVSLEILGQSHWHDRVTAVLKPDACDSDIRIARAVARDLGIDTFEVTFRRIEQDLFASDWYDAWMGADTDRAGRFVALARTRLPLAEIAGGPGDALGAGPEFKAHQALDWSLQGLRDHPGIGDDLLIIGLQSPVTRNLNMALRAIQQRPAESWPSEARGNIEAPSGFRAPHGSSQAPSTSSQNRPARLAISAGYSPLIACDASAHSSTCPRGNRFRARAAARAASSITLLPAIRASTGMSSDRNWSSVNDFGIALRKT
jgi:hypothetical protein